MFTVAFWRGAVERAVKTVAQVLLATYAVGEGFDLFAVDFKRAASVAASAAVLSVLTSIVSAGAGPPGPSLVEDRRP